MDVIGNQLTGKLGDSERCSNGSGLAMTKSLHGVEGMGQVRNAMFSSALHLFIVGSRMRRRDGNSAPHTFVDQPQVLVIFGCQGKQTDDAAFKKLQCLFFFCSADKIHILRAAASRVEIGSLQVGAEQGCPAWIGPCISSTNSSAFMIDARLAVQVVARKEVTPCEA